LGRTPKAERTRV